MSVTIRGNNFSPDAAVYFGGLEARQTAFKTSSQIDAVTPYLSPGTYKVQVKSAGSIMQSDATFTALAGPTDSEIDRALTVASGGDITTALRTLSDIANTNNDYQVRAYAYYQIGQIYFSQGDWARWGAAIWQVFSDSEKAGAAIQTNWRYRLADAQVMYLLHPENKRGFDLWYSNFFDKYDITQNPELRFFRSILNVRHGSFRQAKADSDFILTVDPSNLSYRALAAYISMIAGDKTSLRSLSVEAGSKDPRAARVLAEAFFLSGDGDRAHQLWALAGESDPLGARLSCLAGKTHLKRGDKRQAQALLSGCVSMVPASKEAAEARDLLANSL